MLSIFPRRISMFVLACRTGFTIENSNHGVSLSRLFNIRDAMPESSIYDSAPVQQRYKSRSSRCRCITDPFKY